jgi:uncharacterized phage protein (TIGR02220 family)
MYPSLEWWCPMPGYISLHRDIQKNWLYMENRTFSRYEAWLDILMRVNHAEGKVPHNGTIETVLRGSTIWSMGDMEKHWKWSNSKVRAFLKRLENEGMITAKSTTKKTYLTVIKYDKYQGSDTDKEPPKHHQNTTKTPRKHTNNNVNNDNKYKDTIVEIINYLNVVASKKYSPETKETIKLISGRLTSGRTIEQFKYVIDIKSSQWKGNEKMDKFLKPDTLFSESNFESYLNETFLSIVEKQGVKELTGEEWAKNAREGIKNKGGSA